MTGERTPAEVEVALDALVDLLADIALADLQEQSAPSTTTKEEKRDEFDHAKQSTT